jgi:hypothetical protein
MVMAASQISRQACSSADIVSKQTALAMLDSNDGAYRLLTSIPESDWQITSFDSKSREVCITITNATGLRYLSVVLPFLGAK